ncbi:MAG: putative HTH domain antitoxin [Paracoccaceae bacterium]|jgi:predicted HTH domain antitoxin
MATVTISTRIDEEDCALLDELAAMEFLDRSALVKAAVRRTIHELRLKKALQAFKEEKVTLSRGAEIAGMNIWDFMTETSKQGQTLHYDVEEFEEDLRTIEYLRK